MKLLLGIGGSPDGIDALERTLERVAETGDDLTVALLDTVSTDYDLDELEQKARERIDASDVAAETRRVPGHPGSKLTEIAQREGFDRIVLGGGQRSPMGKINLGEVAEFVLLNADISVTLVR
jgi:nucleotide-binding universal stress UspA family protein